MSVAEVEMALFGCLMFDNESIDAAAEILKPEHFGEPLLGWLFENAMRFRLEGRRVDPITMAPIAEVWARAYDEMGGVGWLVDMVDSAPPAASVGDYAAQVHDGYLRRCSAEIVSDHLKALKDTSRPAFEIIAEARHAIETLEVSGAPEDSSQVTARAAATSAIATMAQLAQDGRPRGRMTGLRCFDRRLGGLLPGKLIVGGGRPGMGKTSLLRAALSGAARRNPDYQFALLGIEMGPEEMVQRELSALSHEAGDGIEYQNMAKGRVTAFDLQLMDSLSERIPPNLILDDVPKLSLHDVQRKVWAMKRRGKIGAVGIDYLQLMQKGEARGRTDAALWGEITMGLKQLARRAETCIFLLSQLSRQVEQREDKKPVMSDLRDSGSIEQDADIILFPFRSFYYDKDKPPKGNKDEWDAHLADTRTLMEVICAKQRQGPTGVDKQTYIAEHDHISDRGEG